MFVSLVDIEKKQKEGRKMKKYLIKIHYGWCEYELKHSCYRDMRTVIAKSEEEAIEIEKKELDNNYLGGEKNIPIYYQILGIMEQKDGNTWNLNHKKLFIEGRAK